MMKLQSKIKSLFALLLLVYSGNLFAQQTFKYQAILPKVDSDGFYKISLKPVLVARSKGTDIRITDQDGKFIPYLPGNQLPVRGEKEFIIFPKSPASKETDTATIFIVENKGHYTIDQLLLKIKRTDVLRAVDLSGSDDLKHWYAIKEDILLNRLEAGNPLLRFPPSAYRYFKIQNNHKHKEPIDIVEAGINRSQITPAKYSRVPVNSFSQKDSAKITRLTIQFNEPFVINKISLNIDGPKLYKRNLRVYQYDHDDKVLFTYAMISSAEPAVIYCENKTGKLEIEILNEDNPPLKIKGIDVYQTEQSIISYLEKGRQYQILLGDNNAVTPNYDLKFFTDSLHKQLPEIQHGAIAANPLYQAKQVKAATGIPVWVIWLAIIAALAVLGLLTAKMAQEIGKRPAEEKK
jgi:hypothetical protein